MLENVGYLGGVEHEVDGNRDRPERAAAKNTTTKL
jgi:hypothetical protein